jgi:hypothetical protein
MTDTTLLQAQELPIDTRRLQQFAVGILHHGDVFCFECETLESSARNEMITFYSVLSVPRDDLVCSVCDCLLVKVLD